MAFIPMGRGGSYLSTRISSCKKRFRGRGQRWRCGLNNMENKNGELEFVRFTQPAMFSLIPRELFEQVAETDESFIVENALRFGPESLLNPATFFYGIISSEENKIVGFLWGGINLLTNQFGFTYASLNKNYQWNGILKQFLGLAKFICETYKLSPIWHTYTIHPRVMERLKGRESPIKIYEFDCNDTITENQKETE